METFNEAYRLKDKHAVLNWFDVTAPEGRFSLNDKLGEILAVPAGAELVKKLFAGLTSGGAVMGGFELSGDMLRMMDGFTVLRLSGMLGSMGLNFTKEQLLALNGRLNRIRKPGGGGK